MKSTVVVTLVLLSVITQLNGQSLNMKTARIDQYGESVLLECSDGPGLTFQYWLLPDLTALDTIQDYGTMELFGNYSLFIPKVEQENLGDYICTMQDNNNILAFFKTKVYLYEPTLWDIYRMNVIIGGAAAGAFLVLATLFCCIANHRWKPKDQDKDDQSSMGDNNGIELVKSHEFDSQGYVTDMHQYSATNSANANYSSPQPVVVSVPTGDYVRTSANGPQGVTQM